MASSTSTMGKRVSAWLLVLVMLLSLLPTAALAADEEAPAQGTAEPADTAEPTEPAEPDGAELLEIITPGDAVPVNAPTGTSEDPFLVSSEEELLTAVSADPADDTQNHIRLAADITVIGRQLLIDKTVTLDLNGKTLKVSGYTANKDQVYVTGALTLEDSSAEKSGTICSDYTGTSGLVVSVGGSGSLTMNGGTITTDGMANAGNALKIGKGASVTFNGGVIRCGAKRGNFAVNVVYGTFIMNGGSVLADRGDGKETFITAINGSSGSTISIVGGTVEGPTAVTAPNSNISIRSGSFTGSVEVKKKSISGGTFSEEVKKEYCADGYTLTRQADGTYSVKETVYEASIGETKYETFAEAVAAVADGGTITLLQDVTVGSPVAVNGKSILLDLNGKTVTGINTDTNSVFTVYSGSGLTLMNGTVAASNSGGAITTRGTVMLQNVAVKGSAKDTALISVNTGAEVTVDANSSVVTMDGAYYPAIILNQNEDGGAKTLDVYGKVAANGMPGIQGNGADQDTSYINIYSGASVTSNKLAMYLPQKCIVNVSGTVSGYCGIGIKSGTLNISGGLVQGTAKDNVIGDQNSKADGISYDGSAILVDSYIGYAGNVTIKITGGKVQSLYSTAIREIGNDPNKTLMVSLNVSGGEVYGASGAEAIAVRSTTRKTVSISGGTFSSPVEKEYCTEGYEPVTNDDGSFGVSNKYVAVYGDTRWADIDEALTAWAEGGGTLELLTDCTADSTEELSVQKNAELRLGGKTLTLSHGYIATSNALTIQNGKIVVPSDGSYYAVCGYYGSDITLTNAEIEGQKSGAVTCGGTLTMDGGKLTGSGYGLSASGSGTFTVKSGEINILKASYQAAVIILGKDGGTYTDLRVNTLSLSSDNNSVEFKSGIVGTLQTYYSPKLTATENAYFVNRFTKGLPAGKTLTEVVKDGSTYYQLADLTAENAAAKVTAADGTETFYDDASVAAAALKAGGTLTLLRDHTGDTLRVRPGSGSVTIDLNNWTVTNKNGPGLYVVINGDPDETAPYTITVKNGTLASADSVALRADSVNNAADVVTENVTLTPGADHSPVELQDSARLVFTDEATATQQLGTGYAVTADGKNYAFGIIGGLSYAAKTLPAEGGAVKLLNDYTGSEKMTYTDNTGKNVTLDLNGKTYNCTYAEATAALEFNRPNSRLTVKNGTIISAGLYGVYAVASDYYPTASANDLKLTLDGVTVSAPNGNGIGVNGVLTGNETVIRNSTVTSGDTGIYYPANGTLMIENTTVTGEKLGIVFKGGTAEISGENTRITANAAEKEPTDYYDGGNTGSILAEGYAVYMEGGYNRGISLTISGGTFTSRGDALKKYVKDTDTGYSRTISVSGGTFSSPVKEEFCADGYEPKDNSDGTYTVARKQTPTPTPTPEPSATPTPTPTQKPTPKPTSSTRYPTYTTPAPVKSSAIPVTVKGTKFTVNGAAKQESFTGSYAKLATVTVKYTGSEEFVCWVNASGNIVTTEKSFRLTVVGKTELTAITCGKDRKSGETLLVYENAAENGQLVHTETVTAESVASEKFASPAAVAMPGREFTYWTVEIGGERVEATADVLKAQIESGAKALILAPEYEAAGTYRVQLLCTDEAGAELQTPVVYTGMETGMLKYVTAPDISGYTFSCWKDETGRAVGTNRKYAAFSADADALVTLTAVYVPAGQTAAKNESCVTLSLTDAAKTDGAGAISFAAIFSVLDNRTVVKRGFLYTDNSRKTLTCENAEDLKTFEWDSETENCGRMVVTLGLKDTLCAVYVRAFAVLDDGTVVYSDMVSYSVDTAIDAAETAADAELPKDNAETVETEGDAFCDAGSVTTKW